MSRHGEVQDGDSRSPVNQQNSSLQGDTSNDERSTNNVGIMTDHISHCVSHV